MHIEKHKSQISVLNHNTVRIKLHYISKLLITRKSQKKRKIIYVQYW